MTHFDFEQFFVEVKAIHDKYRLTGENFNIFKVLGIERSEIQHSAFLAELLNVQGSHGQGSKYLDLFLKQTGMVDFDSKTSKTIVEYHIGEVDNEEKEGGNIDILIRHREKRCIIIENKINARDQRNQLKRYHNSLKNGGKLFYLNLFGNKPSKESIDDLIEGKHYHIITYQSDILQWLERCLKESENLPIIKETIKQYINVIKKITYQMQPMDMKIVEFVTKSSENMEAARIIAESFDDAKQEILNKFWEALWKKLCLVLKNEVQEVRPIKSDKNDYTEYYKGRQTEKGIIRIWVNITEKSDYQLCWCAEIEQNFYTGFRICDKEGKPVVDKSVEVENIVKYLIDKSYFTEKDYKTEYEKVWLGWKYSNWELNFKEFNTQDIFALTNRIVMECVVGKIVKDALEDIKEVKRLWNKNSK